jgi:type II secretion system protein H
MMMKQQGYTLIELIVVMVLLGLIVGLVSMSFSRSLPGVKLKATVREFSSTLRYAQNKAQIRNEEMTVTIDLDSGQFWLEERKRLQFPDETKVAVIDPNRDKVMSGIYDIFFYPGGGSSGEEVHIQRGKNIYSVKVDPLVGSVLNKVRE